MSRLLPNVLVLTLSFTVLAFVVTFFHLGPGLVLYLAALGPQAAWLLPVHIAVALPPGLFGGALLAASGSRAASDRPRPRQIAGATVAVTLVSLVLVGWVLPEGYRATSAAMERFRSEGVERPAEPPASLDLPELLAEESSAAEADLQRRTGLVVPCLVLGLIAAGLVASPLSWSHLTGLGLAALAFIWQMRRFSSLMEQ